MLGNVELEGRVESGMEERGETSFWQAGALFTAEHE